MSNINYKVLKEKIETIPSNQLIVVAGHKNPDMDSIGASLSLVYFLNKLNKRAIMLLENKEYENFEFLRNNQLITDKVDEDAYIFFLMDSNKKERLWVFERYFDNASCTFNIDHHENNKNESDYVLSDSKISSTCEMVYKLINLFNKKIDKKISELLYAGIITDTNCFLNNVTSDTFKVAGILLDFGIDYNYIIRKFYLGKNKDEFEVLKDMINNITYDGFFYIIIDRNKDVYRNISYNNIVKKIVPIILQYDEINMLATIIVQNKIVRVSLRSNIFIDVEKIAKEFGGGGHKEAAAFQVENIKVEEIIKKIKKYIS